MDLSHYVQEGDTHKKRGGRWREWAVGRRGREGETEVSFEEKYTNNFEGTYIFIDYINWLSCVTSH